MVFSASVISQIESIGGGWAGGSGGMQGRVETGLKHPFRPKEQCYTLQYGTQTDAIHKGGQDCHQGRPRTPCNPIKAHEIHPRGLTTSVKSHL